MFDAIVSRLRSIFHAERKPDRVSILLPFLIISIGLGVLAWRSYVLSARAERGAKTLAAQYAGYAADITARRVDAAVRAEMGRVSDEWQQMERRTGDVTFVALRDWIAQHEWIVSAIYVPDFDPASSIYANEVPSKNRGSLKLTREFFTSSGMVRYTYDPQRLLTLMQETIRHQPLVGAGDAPGTIAIEKQADVTWIYDVKQEGLRSVPEGFDYVASLAPPLERFGVRAHVRTAGLGGKGWENQRVISLWVSLLALVFTGIGTVLALAAIRKENETMLLRGALVANVSHELRTPLSMIRLGAETLKRGKLTPQERASIEDQILREVLLLSHLVENVLDVARIQARNTRALAFTPVAPRDLIRNLIATYDSWIRSKGFEVVLHLDESVGEQMWDRDAVSRALLNLIDNAIKYSGDDRTIDVTLRQTLEYVAIEVRDRGIGIEGSDVTRIFDPYYRAKFSDTITRRGAGLGLTLVQQIVASHGGKVEVQSVPGEGSTFRLLFPRDLARVPDHEAEFPRASAAL